MRILVLILGTLIILENANRQKLIELDSNLKANSEVIQVKAKAAIVVGTF